MNDNYFALFASNILFTGYSRGIIVDCDLNRVFFIPKWFCELFIDATHINILNIDNKSELQEAYKFIEYLESENWGFFTNEPDLFQKLKLEFCYPKRITNVIVDLSEKVEQVYATLFKQIGQMEPQILQIRSFTDFSLDFVSLLLGEIEEEKVEYIQLIMKYNKHKHNLENIKTFLNNNNRIYQIFFFNAEITHQIEFDNHKVVTYRISDFNSILQCGYISKSYFDVSRYTIYESANHNSCLNRKISIDSEGNIKNCPSMSQVFGNIKDTTLEESLNHPDFKKYWNITKDQINVCKDCEFRYICTDCRAYVEDPADIYSKPLKCGYNPYTAEWEEWSTHPLKQKAIDFYGMREVLPEFKLKPDYVPPRNANAPATSDT